MRTLKLFSLIACLFSATMALHAQEAHADSAQMLNEALAHQGYDALPWEVTNQSTLKTDVAVENLDVAQFEADLSDLSGSPVGMAPIGAVGYPSTQSINEKPCDGKLVRGWVFNPFSMSFHFFEICLPNPKNLGSIQHLFE